MNMPWSWHFQYPRASIEADALPSPVDCQGLSPGALTLLHGTWSALHDFLHPFKIVWTTHTLPSSYTGLGCNLALLHYSCIKSVLVSRKHFSIVPEKHRTFPLSSVDYLSITDDSWSPAWLAHTGFKPKYRTMAPGPIANAALVPSWNLYTSLQHYCLLSFHQNSPSTSANNTQWLL